MGVALAQKVRRAFSVLFCRKDRKDVLDQVVLAASEGVHQGLLVSVDVYRV